MTDTRLHFERDSTGTPICCDTKGVCPGKDSSCPELVYPAGEFMWAVFNHPCPKALGEPRPPEEGKSVLGRHCISCIYYDSCRAKGIRTLQTPACKDFSYDPYSEACG